MFGGQSIQIARVFGVRIGVHPSWFIAFFLFIWWLSDYYKDVLAGDEALVPFALAVASTALFFLSVVLHELGHALVARRNKIAIAGIDLWLFGGVARMTKDTPSAGAEFRIAAAGPLVTAVIVAVCGGLGLLAGEGGQFTDAIELKQATLSHWWLALLAWLTTINLVVLIFNLIPAYPLDGGRITRAIAWAITGDRQKATKFAAVLGRGFSFVLIGLGLFTLIQGDIIGAIWFIFLGFILGQAAQGAQMQSSVSARIEGVTVADVMDREPVAVPANFDLDRAMQEFFLRYGDEWFPVVDLHGRYVGVVTLRALHAVDPGRHAVTLVQDIMQADRGGSLLVSEGEEIENVLGRQDLAKIGALMAVDAAGKLSGVITVDQIRRVLTGQTPRSSAAM